MLIPFFERQWVEDVEFFGERGFDDGDHNVGQLVLGEGVQHLPDAIHDGQVTTVDQVEQLKSTIPEVIDSC